jgi:hypothetical protein
MSGTRCGWVNRSQLTSPACDFGTLSELGLKAGDLQAPWVGVRKPTVLQCLGEAVSRQAGISAIRFPSDAARKRGFSGANVVIFRECVRQPDHVHILEPTRNPLQKWP